MINVLLESMKNAAERAGVHRTHSLALAELFMDILENTLYERTEDVLHEEIEFDDYCDFMERWQAGCHRFRQWVRVNEVGKVVKLTKEGRRMLREVIHNTDYSNVFEG